MHTQYVVGVHSKKQSELIIHSSTRNFETWVLYIQSRLCNMPVPRWVGEAMARFHAISWLLFACIFLNVCGIKGKASVTCVFDHAKLAIR
jgi:hypothetical protein